jgi:hypothetical protein
MILLSHPKISMSGCDHYLHFHFELDKSFQILSGISGKSSYQTWVASCTAAATAGAKGRTGISPTPRAPHGPRGSGFQGL